MDRIPRDCLLTLLLLSTLSCLLGCVPASRKARKRSLGERKLKCASAESVCGFQMGFGFLFGASAAAVCCSESARLVLVSVDGRVFQSVTVPFCHAPLHTTNSDNHRAPSGCQNTVNTTELLNRTASLISQPNKTSSFRSALFVSSRLFSLLHSTLYIVPVYCTRAEWKKAALH